MSKKLLQFDVDVNDSKKELVFYGNYQKDQVNIWGNDRTFDTIKVDEESVRLMEIIDGKEVPFEVDGDSWAGYRYDAIDAFQMTWTSLTQGMVDGPYHFTYVDEGIQTVADNYKQECIEDINGNRIQQYFLYREPNAVYEVSAATQDELYYLNLEDEGVIDIGRNDRRIYSDNFFAENAYFGLLYDEDLNEPIVYLRESDAEIVKKEKQKTQENMEKQKNEKPKIEEIKKKSSVLAKLHENQEKLKAKDIRKKAPQKNNELEFL